MSDLQKLQNQIKNKLLSNVIEGVNRFPQPSPHFFETLNVIQQNSFNPISKCNLCSLASKRKRVVVENHIVSKSFFVLSDFPDSFDESFEGVFAPQSPLSSIVLNLLNKLGIIEDCHFSFAIKCVPEKGLPNAVLKTCASQNLSKELVEVKPKCVLCFGHRAFQALGQIDQNLNYFKYLENTGFAEIFIEGAQIKVFFLSSIRDLRDYPLWRHDVWNVLKTLSNKSSY